MKSRLVASDMTGMNNILRNGFQEYAIRDPYATDREDVSHPVQFDHVNTAQSFLRQFLDGNANRMTLRDILTRHEVIGRMSLMTIDDVVEQIAQKLVSGELQVEALPIVFRTGVRGQAVEAEETAADIPSPEIEEDTHWIDFQIIDDESELPVNNVTLKIKLPNGEIRDFPTGANGMIKIKDIDAGSCDIVQMRDSKSLEVVRVE